MSAVSETSDHLNALAEPPCLDQLRRQLLPFCHRYPIARLEVFGSVADGTATAVSDVDLMVTFDAGVRVGKEFFALALKLEDILGRQVDLVERAAIERILSSAWRSFPVSN